MPELAINPFEQMDQEDFELLAQHDQEDRVHEQFRIDTDQKAEWALNKIKTIQEEYNRLENVCINQAKFYQEKAAWYKSKAVSETSYLKGMLAEYFDKVPHKKTKTQEKYELPSGSLIRKKVNPEFVRNDEEIVAFLACNERQDLFEIKTKVKWADLKSEIELRESKEGLVAFLHEKAIEGLVIQVRPDEFEVKVN